MIWRIWTLLLVVFVGGVWLLAIPYSPEPILKTGTVIPLYRAMGIVPEVGEITVSEEIDHEVFEVPEGDAEQLKMQMTQMGGMNMGGQSMGEQTMQSAETMPTMNMGNQAMQGQGMQEQAMQNGDNMPAMNMNNQAMQGQTMQEQAMPNANNMPAMNMENQAKESQTMQNAEKMPEQAMDGMSKMASEEAEGHGEDAAGGLMFIAQGTSAEVDAILAKKGIRIASVSNLDMKEWGFETGSIMGEPGQRVRLRIRNTGNIPHEFMIMNSSLMNAVNYRLDRPDWNLLEHEALSEVPFIMPGDSIDMVFEIKEPGVWMYMCMFPYHMQMGMMGMMMTPDMMGKMAPMGGMKM